MSGQSVASFRLGPRLGEAVATYGFPYHGILSSSGNFTLGNVTSLTGMGDDTRFFQMSTPIQPGNSGGPLLDMSGTVVGVMVSQLSAVNMMKVGNSVPQNVNISIQNNSVLPQGPTHPFSGRLSVRVIPMRAICKICDRRRMHHE
jgi:S1-C subfamily serine protease